METAKRKQISKKKGYISPKLLVKGDIAALTLGEKTFGTSDGWWMQGQGLQTVTS